MSDFESIFIPYENVPSPPQSRRARLKMGEIFHCGKAYAFVCIHCSTEFGSFSTFSDHVQQHLADVCRNHMTASKQKQDIENEAKHESTNYLDDLSADDGSMHPQETMNEPHTMDMDSAGSDAEDSSVGGANLDTDETSTDSTGNGELSQCPLCAKSFSTLNGLQTHLQDDHKRTYAAETIKLVDKPLKCEEVRKLNEKGTKEEYLSVQKKLRDEGFELDNSAQARDFFKYIYDFDDLNADTIDLFQCPKCPHVGKQMSKMRTHIFKHLEEKIFVCLECKRAFNRVGAIRQHVHKIHRKKRKSCHIVKNGRNDVQKSTPNFANVSETIDRKLRLRRNITRSTGTDSESSSESASSSDDDSDYEPEKAIVSDAEPACEPENVTVNDECSDSDVDGSRCLDSDPKNDNQKQVMLTSDDFQQHSKAQAKFKRKYIEISDTPAAIEYAKYALMSDFKYSAVHFQCPKCSHSCTKFFEMRRHIFTHLREKIFTCMFCKRKSNQLTRMEVHASDHVKNNCRKTFEQLAAVKNEHNMNDSSNEKINKQLAIIRKRMNPHCIELENSPEGIKYAKYYLLHDIKITDGHFECPQCHALILSRASIRKHLFRHIKADIFSCMICHERYSAYEFIRRHMKEKHLKHINANAGAEFSDQIDDEDIQENMATDIAAIQDKQRVLCTICGASVKANGLKKHINIHERKADFKCDLCDKTFLRRCTLLEHRRIHPEPMPYHCGICNKGYTLKKGLVRHSASHGKM